MKRLLLILMVFASVAMAGGHTGKINDPGIIDAKLREIIQAEFGGILQLQPRLAVAAWIALDPDQRQQILHYSTPQERAVMVRYFEYILKTDGLKPSD